MKKILFISSSSQRCGIHQFGKSTSQVLSQSKRYLFSYVECSSNSNGAIEFLNALQKHKPNGVIYNWNSLTMSWLSDELFQHVAEHMPNLMHLAIVHEEQPPFHWMDALIHLDPNFEEQKTEYRVGRLIPDYITKQKNVLENVIGSFGFSCKHKNYKKIIDQVNKEFDQAHIRLHIPFNSYGDVKGQQALQQVEECKKLAKPGITIEASHDFLDQENLLEWLAGNTINCFFFDRCEGRGISSSIELALAARKPIAITNSCMFRHVIKAEPSIIIDQSSLKQIIANGLKPLAPFYEKWTKGHLITDYECILDKVLTDPHPNLKKNGILSKSDQFHLKKNIEEFVHWCPELSTDINDSGTYHNALVFQQVTRIAKKSDQLVVIIDEENPLGLALQKQGFQVKILTVQAGYLDLETVWRESILLDIKYDIAICCSLLEKLEDDSTFIKQIYHILKPGGLAILCAHGSDQAECTQKNRHGNSAKRIKALFDRFHSPDIVDQACWTAFLEPSVQSTFYSITLQKNLQEATTETEFARIYIFKRYEKKLQNCITDLTTQLADFHQIKGFPIRLAKKINSFYERYPKIIKTIKMGISGLRSLKRQLFAYGQKN